MERELFSKEYKREFDVRNLGIAIMILGLILLLVIMYAKVLHQGGVALG
ncbi:MAG: hypothetical protein V1743_00095 [Nanoarchaeota archaeon]